MIDDCLLPCYFKSVRRNLIISSNILQENNRNKKKRLFDKHMERKKRN